jgi:hypothetical protein
MKLAQKFTNAAFGYARAVLKKSGISAIYDCYSGAVLLKSNGIEKSGIAGLRGTGAAAVGGLSMASAAYAPFSYYCDSPIFAEPVVSHAAHYFTASAVMLALYGGVLWASAASEVYIAKVVLPREQKAHEEYQRRIQEVAQRRSERRLAAAARRAKSAPVAPAPAPAPTPAPAPPQ